MIIRMLKELKENCNNMKRDVETMNKNKTEMKNIISERKIY